MSFEILTESQESLLKEILDHRDENGNCDVQYWVNKLECSAPAEDTRIRDIFRYLKENDYINVFWADDTVYLLELLNDGLTYFENKKASVKEQKKLTNREWKISIISALIGALVGLLPTIIQLIRG